MSNLLLVADSKQYILPIAALLQAYQNEDPPTFPSLAVPIELMKAMLLRTAKETKRERHAGYTKSKH